MLIAGVRVLFPGLRSSGFFARSVGKMLPVFGKKKRIDIDPAVASDPLFNTITGMCDFFVLSLASLVLPHLMSLIKCSTNFAFIS
jgi:Mg/Co/Ni transporter MgtE